MAHELAFCSTLYFQSQKTTLFNINVNTHQRSNSPETKMHFKKKDMFLRELGLGGQFVGTMYTHHQKTVICDAQYDEGDDESRFTIQKIT